MVYTIVAPRLVPRSPQCNAMQYDASYIKMQSLPLVAFAPARLAAGVICEKYCLGGRCGSAGPAPFGRVDWGDAAAALERRRFCMAELGLLDGWFGCPGWGT